MEIHHSKDGLLPGQQPQGGGKRVVHVAIHPKPSNQVQHPDLNVSALVNPPAAARHTPAVVGGTQQVGVVVQPVANLPLAKSMVAQSHDVRSRLVELLHLPGRHAGQRHVLPIYHSEMNILPLLYTPQMPLHMGQSLLPHYVADCQNMIDHSPHILSFFRYSIPALPEKSNIAAPFRQTSLLQFSSNSVILPLYK